MATAINRTATLPAIRSQAATGMGMWLAFLVFYTIAFPKGGIKAGGVPLTIGYVLTTLLLATALLRGGRLSVPFDRLMSYGGCLLLGLWSLLVVNANGTEAPGFTISYFISVLYLPVFGLVFFSSMILDEHGVRIERTLVWAVRFVVVYGIFLFMFKQATGKWIEIPYVTVNAADVGQLDDKHINRGGIFKLISTYNNGNILGVCLAIMSPLYLRLENRKILTWALYLAMFLTLSRTAWIAAILIMVMSNLAKGLKPISVLYLILGTIAAVLTMVGMLDLLGRDMSFVFDRNLGGRSQQLTYLEYATFFPEEQVNALPEIVYLGVLRYFGVPGLILFVLHLLLPSLLLRVEGIRLLTPSRASACLQGLVVYVIVAGADAAFSFIPVMMVFWMIAGMGFWYARNQALLSRGVREAPR